MKRESTPISDQEKILNRLAWSVADGIHRYGDEGDETVDETIDLALAVGHTVELVLGGESDRWRSRVEHWYVPGDDAPLFRAAVKVALAEFRRPSLSLFPSAEERRAFVPGLDDTNPRALLGAARRAIAAEGA